MSWLERLGRQSVTQPLTRTVANNSEAYLQHTGLQKLGWRSLRRRWAVALMGQNSRYRTTASPEWKRGLWIYEGIPQIGDALMDLAPRSLFEKTGITLDVVAPAHIAALLQDDPWFHRVFTFEQVPSAKDYDFAIVMGHKHRSLKFKKKYLPKLPWLSLHEHFTGPEFQRAELATQRLIDLFGLKITARQFNTHAQQKLKPLISQAIPPQTQTLKVGIAIGGVDEKRIYAHWISFIQHLKNPLVTFYLLGSDNAVTEAEAIEQARLPSPIINTVNQQPLAQCRETINNMDLMLCCDGGLMHLALTTTTPTVCLFNALVHPDWRLPQSNNCTALQSGTPEVSAIPPELIARKVASLLNL